MLVGMDVTHPGPGSLKGTPSIAAIVGSVDEHYAQFPASMRIQKTRKEVRIPAISLEMTVWFTIFHLDDY